VAHPSVLCLSEDFGRWSPTRPFGSKSTLSERARLYTLQREVEIADAALKGRGFEPPRKLLLAQVVFPVLGQALRNGRGQGRACAHVLAGFLAGIAEDNILGLGIDDGHDNFVKRSIVISACTNLREKPLDYRAVVVLGLELGGEIRLLGIDSYGNRDLFLCSAEEK